MNDNSLTVREREIATMVGEGLSDRQVARQLQISAKTVRAHIDNINRKIQGASHRRTKSPRYIIWEWARRNLDAA